MLCDAALFVLTSSVWLFLSLSQLAWGGILSFLRFSVAALLFELIPSSIPRLIRISCWSLFGFLFTWLPLAPFEALVYVYILLGPVFLLGETLIIVTAILLLLEKIRENEGTMNKVCIFFRLFPDSF